MLQISGWWLASCMDLLGTHRRLLKGSPDDDEDTPSASELRQQVEAFLSQPSDEWPLPVHSVASIKAGAQLIVAERMMHIHAHVLCRSRRRQGTHVLTFRGVIQTHRHICMSALPSKAVITVGT